MNNKKICNGLHNECQKCQEHCPLHAVATDLSGKTTTRKLTDEEQNFEVKINVKMIKELVSDKIYQSDASAFREQYVNALSHGCVAYHEEHGYSDECNVHVEFDFGKRKVIITDNGMGMTRQRFEDNFMSFGFSTVGKKTNNTRSGMFGLGAISFFRIATVCIVESWDSETNERFSFMTRNTDESEFNQNRVLTEHGTRTEIHLKDHVRMNTLVAMVKSIASNYPVKTILEISNSEAEQSISTYQNEDNDSYDEFPPTMRFKDYVDNVTNSKFTEIINNDEMELYLATAGGDKIHSYLCRIPIEIECTTGFTTYLNIKREKIKGTDRHGKDILQEVPKPDRDSVNEIAQEYFSEKIEKLVDDMLEKIDITSYDQYLKSEERWILSGYSVDDRLNAKTHKFIQQLREPVRHRNKYGIQKRRDSLLNILAEYKYVFMHPSLHKGTFVSIEEWHKRKDYKTMVAAFSPTEQITEAPTMNQYQYNEVAFVNDTNGLPIQTAKAYKKLHFIPSVTGATRSSGAVSGLLVRDGSYNNHRITDADALDVTKRYPGGLFFGDGVLGQWNLPSNESGDLSRQKNFLAGVYRRSKSGVVVAKTGKKLTSIKTWANEVIKDSKDGKIISSKHGPMILEKGDGAVFKGVPFSSNKNILLPLQWKNIEFLKYVTGKEFIFLPHKYMHTMRLACFLSPPNWKEVQFISLLKGIKNWTKVDPQILGSVLAKVPWMHRSYQRVNNKCLIDVVNYILDLKITKIDIDEKLFTSVIESIMGKYGVDNYSLNYGFKEIFPEKYLIQKAKNQGFKDTSKIKDDDTKILAYTPSLNNGEIIPVEINGEYYSAYKPKFESDGTHNYHEDELDVDELYHFKAISDNDGNAIMVKDPDQNNTCHKIVMRNGKLKFIKEITEWD